MFRKLFSYVEGFVLKNECQERGQEGVHDESFEDWSVFWTGLLNNRPFCKKAGRPVKSG